MKKIIFFIAFFIVTITVNAQYDLIKKGIKVGAGGTKTLIDTTELKRIKQIDEKVSTADMVELEVMDTLNVTHKATVPTMAAGTNTTDVANTIFVTNAFNSRRIAHLIFPTDAASGLPASNTGNTNENTVLTFTIPDTLVYLNTAFHIQTLLSATNNSNTKTIRVKFNGTTVFSFDMASGATASTYTIIRNRNSESVQISGNTSAASTNATFGTKSGTSVSTYSITMTGDVTVTVTVQNANSSDTTAIEGFELFVIG